MKSIEDFKKEVAKENGLGRTLVTGHLSKYWEEVCKRYAIETNKKIIDEAIQELRNEFYSETHPWKPGQLENCIDRLKRIVL